MTAVRVPAEQQPERISASPSGARKENCAIDGSQKESQRARSSASAGTIFRGAGRGVRGEFARYVVVGGIAFICDAGTLYSVTQFLKVNYLISAPIGFLVGTLVNYTLSRTWVFERRTLKSRSAELTIFTLIGLVGLGLNELILWLFQSKLGIYYMFAKGVSGGVVLVWNFGARKLVLFR
ncbi:MAG TPA: GtrA family protein [Terriglobia bacterium]|nr:GtrA family protein [Terriglobia bacterium]